MRAAHLVSAACRDHHVVLVVIPAAGSIPGGNDRSARPGSAQEGPVGLERHDLDATTPGDHADVMRWMADPVWRDRLAALAPLPDAVAAAPPTRAVDVINLIGARPVVGVLGCRLTTAPLALAVAETLDVPLIVDADDDDVALCDQRHEHAQAEQWQRVADLCLPRADLVLVSSPADQVAITDRNGLGDRVGVAPNAAPSAAPTYAPPGNHQILFVANFTYGPNEDGACWFVEEVLPLIDPAWTIDLVGSPSAAVEGLASGRVRVLGWVGDLAPAYAEADVVVAPLLSGSGTRIKILEAWNHRRPVVSTSRGAAGLEGVDGTHLLIRDEPASFAGAIAIAADPTTAATLAEAAGDLVGVAYDAEHLSGVLAADLDQVTGSGPRADVR